MPFLKKLSFYLVTLLFIFFATFPAHGKIEEPEKEVESTITQIRNIHNKMLEPEHCSFWSESWLEYFLLEMKRRFEPYKQKHRMNAFSFLNKNLAGEKNDAKAKISPSDRVTTWTDLNLFCTEDQKDTGKFVANIVDRTRTEIGKVSLYYQLSQPTRERAILEERQKIISTLVENETLSEELDSALAEMGKTEPITFSSIWEYDHIRQLAKNRFCSTPLINSLNKAPSAILVKNYWQHIKDVIGAGTMTVAAAALILYGLHNGISAISKNSVKKNKNLNNWANEYKAEGGTIFRYLWKTKKYPLIHSLVSITGGYFCLKYMKSCWENVLGMFLLDHLIEKITRHLALYIRSTRSIYNLIKENREMALFDEFKDLTNFYEKDLLEDPELKWLIGYCNSYFLKGKPNLFSHKGFIIRTYIMIDKLKEKLRPMIAAVGRLDAYLSYAKVYKESQDKRVKFCFAEFVDSEKPLIKARGLWHPLIDQEKVVTNEITLGTDGQRPNVVLTGPNEGGKSSFLKALAISLFMVHTIGMASAESFTTTPFESISTYLNITDDIGSGNSLFKAEVKRAQELLEKLKNSGPGEFHFTVFDEVFNGTTPREGAAAAYGLAKHIGQFKNGINIVATHFPLLTRLETDTNSFVNYKIPVLIEEAGKITYPYKLRTGISNQNVAIDILQDEGFSGEIIDAAYEVLQ